MTLALSEAVVTRWNATGLDVAIGPLHLGDREAAPEGTVLPRAQYGLPNETERTRSRASRELLQELRFQIWGSDDQSVQQFLEQIEDMFVDAEFAPINPFAISSVSGQVLAIDYVNRAVIQESASVFQGVLQLQIQWCKSALYTT